MTALAKRDQPVMRPDKQQPDKQTVEKITWPIDLRLLVAVLGALLYHGVLSIYGTYRNTYDAYVHIFFADHWRRGWFGHWDPRWYTGFTLTSYPPLSQQSVAALSFLTGDLRLSFAIVHQGAHVGNVGLKDYEPGRKDAECFIEIGDPRLRGKGVGRQAMALLMDHCFERLGLNVIRLGVFDFNHSAIRLYQGLGFRRSGRYGWHWSSGRYHEVLGMFIDGDTWRLRRGGHRP